MSTSFAPMKPMATHFDADLGLGSREPLCHAVSGTGVGYAKTKYTLDVERVTCMRCTAKLARLLAPAKVKKD